MYRSMSSDRPKWRASDPHDRNGQFPHKFPFENSSQMHG
jgi:hypothetical protein